MVTSLLYQLIANQLNDILTVTLTAFSLQLFHSTPPEHRSGPYNEPLHLVGVVCYYGKHYSTFFFHSKVQEWFYFDDASVKQVSYQTTISLLLYHQLIDSHNAEREGEQRREEEERVFLLSEVVNDFTKLMKFWHLFSFCLIHQIFHKGT